MKYSYTSSLNHNNVALNHIYYTLNASNFKNFFFYETCKDTYNSFQYVQFRWIKQLDNNTLGPHSSCCANNGIFGVSFCFVPTLWKVYIVSAFRLTASCIGGCEVTGRKESDTSTHRCTHARTPTPTHMHVCTHTPTYAHARAHTPTHMHIRTHTCAHTNRFLGLLWSIRVEGSWEFLEHPFSVPTASGEQVNELQQYSPLLLAWGSIASEGQDFGEWLLPSFFQETDCVTQCKKPTTRNIWTNNLFQQQARNK